MRGYLNYMFICILFQMKLDLLSTVLLSGFKGFLGAVKSTE